MEDFEISHPGNRARLAVALLFASVSIISCLSSWDPVAPGDEPHS
jgi:hypothetical protein